VPINPFNENSITFNGCVYPKLLERAVEKG
jgi:hypothetical protein